jgi:hypothetical protein
VEDSDLSITYLKKANEIAREGSEAFFLFHSLLETFILQVEIPTKKARPVTD